MKYISRLIVYIILLSLGTIISGCKSQNDEIYLSETKDIQTSVILKTPHLIVLGIAQDAGYPQAACKKSCCSEVWNDKSKRKMVSCLGIRDPQNKTVYLFDATPDIKDQLQTLKYYGGEEYQLDGIFLTHAHIGHYTGLMHLGREAMNAKNIPTYVMPRMQDFLMNNGPWSLLLKMKNIAVHELMHNKKVPLSSNISVTPIQVPHRDEFSETVGFIIEGAERKALFIPDIDKWAKWKTNIEELIAEVDYAYLDGTFFRNGEIWGRDMSEIPHPFISESMRRFDKLPVKEKKKIHFIHLNHTNPLLDKDSEEYRTFSKSAYHIADEFETIEL